MRPKRKRDATDTTGTADVADSAAHESDASETEATHESDASEAARIVASGGDPTTVGADRMIALQRLAGNRALGDALGDGRVLPSSVKGDMESLVGESLDEVRIHDDAEGARIADRRGAQAVTSGQDIAFAAGAFRPGTIDGDALIAHEVAHTVQQRDASSLEPAAFREDGAGERSEEREADQAMSAVLARRLTGRLQRLRVRQRRAVTAARSMRICSREPSLEEVQSAVERAEQITSLAESATGNPEARRHFARANEAFGRLGGYVDTAVNVQERAQDAWDIIDALDNLDRIQDDSGAWADQQAAAHEFGRLFAAAGRIMEATNIPGLASYGTFLSGAGDFFTNMYEVVNVDAITRNRARRQGLEQYMP